MNKAVSVKSQAIARHIFLVMCALFLTIGISAAFASAQTPDNIPWQLNPQSPEYKAKWLEEHAGETDQNSEDNIKALIEHDDLRDMRFTFKLFGINWDSWRIAYQYDNTQLYTFYIRLRTFDDVRPGPWYEIQVNGNHLPTFDTMPAGASLTWSHLQKVKCISFNNIRRLLTSKGITETKEMPKDAIEYKFTRSTPDLDTLVQIDTQSTNRGCIDFLSLRTWEHSYGLLNRK